MIDCVCPPLHTDEQLRTCTCSCHYIDRDTTRWEQALRESEQATEAHTAALRAVSAEMRRTTDLAQQYRPTSDFEAKKFLADIFSGQFGRGITGRQFVCRPRFNWFERLAGRLIAYYAVLRSL